MKLEALAIAIMMVFSAMATARIPATISPESIELNCGGGIATDGIQPYAIVYTAGAPLCPSLVNPTPFPTLLATVKTPGGSSATVTPIATDPCVAPLNRTRYGIDVSRPGLYNMTVKYGSATASCKMQRPGTDLGGTTKIPEFGMLMLPFVAIAATLLLRRKRK